MFKNTPRFSPEHLGITASSLLAWLLAEVLLIWLCLYLLAVSSHLRWLDIIAYCGYKYVCMIVILAGGMLAGTYGYYATLGYTALAIAYFLVSAMRHGACLELGIFLECWRGAPSLVVDSPPYTQFSEAYKM